MIKVSNNLTDASPKPSTSHAFSIANEYTFLNNLFDHLFPINRSILGQGIRQSYRILNQFVPFDIYSFNTGTTIFDWTVPKEWLIRDATLTGPDGNVYADFKTSNLHVLNYSIPIDVTIDYDDLVKHVYTLPDLPAAIPYVTSYYQPNWGFCLSHDSFQSMPKGQYKAYIDSDHVDGTLDIAQTILPGRCKKEIFLSSYLCHPSMANNELSGPLCLILLYHRIKKWPKRNYSYRFVLNPETIGSLALLDKFGEDLKQNVISGLVLTCLGGPEEKLSYKYSKQDYSLANALVNHLNSLDKTYATRLFDPSLGSDERQYCSAGFNLPIGQFSRTVYSQYDGYHNSLDDKDFMTIQTLIKSVDDIERFLWNLEHSGKYINLKPYGEPQLGKYGLYPSINSKRTRESYSSDSIKDNRYRQVLLRNILSYSDGKNTMLDIANRCKEPISKLIPVITLLEKKGLLIKDEIHRENSCNH